MSFSLLEKIKKNPIVKNMVSEENDFQVTEFISTDCAIMNLACSGSPLKGIPVGKITCFSMPSALGKSMFGLKILKNAQKKEKIAILIDTEFSFDPELAKKIGIDLEKLIIIQESSIEEIQKFIMNLVSDLSSKERKDIVIVLDSFGGLITSKTVEDSISGKDVLDMTISKKKNSFMRLLQSLNTTVFIVNHVYDNIGSFVGGLSIPGGKGIIFASSVIILGNSKAKEKDGDEVSGSIVSCTIFKSRFSREHKKFKYRIKQEGGIDPYYGLLDLILEYSDTITDEKLKPLYKSSSGWYTVNINNESKKLREKDLYTKEIWKSIFEQYPDFLRFLESEFSYKHSEMFNDDLEF